MKKNNHSKHKKSASKSHDSRYDTHAMRSTANEMRHTYTQPGPPALKEAGIKEFLSSNYAAWAKKILHLKDSQQVDFPRYKETNSEEYVKWPK